MSGGYTEHLTAAQTLLVSILKGANARCFLNKTNYFAVDKDKVWFTVFLHKSRDDPFLCVHRYPYNLIKNIFKWLIPALDNNPFL